ncbi:MAG TPA: hypothetical protein VF043_13375 [Ktedonobacteraceae bacterium]
MNYEQSNHFPAGYQPCPFLAQTPASLQEQRPQCEREDDADDLLLTGQFSARK